MLIEAMHQLLNIVPHGVVTIDQLCIVVTEGSVHLWEPGFEVKENRAASQECLCVSAHRAGEKWFELTQQLRLAPSPLQKRLRFGVILILKACLLSRFREQAPPVQIGFSRLWRSGLSGRLRLAQIFWHRRMDSNSRSQISR